MAAAWISSMIAGGVQSAIQPAVSSAGAFAGGAVSSVGSGVNGVGEGINGYIRRYGTGIQDYGNAIRDWTAADGPRAQTASNPLGLSSTRAGGKMRVTRPSLPPVANRSTAATAISPSRTQPRSTKETASVTAAASYRPRKEGVQASMSVTTDTRRKQATGKPKTKSRPSPTTAAMSAGKVSARPSKSSSANMPNTNKVRISPESKPQSLSAKQTTNSMKQTSTVKGKKA